MSEQIDNLQSQIKNLSNQLNRLENELLTLKRKRFITIKLPSFKIPTDPGFIEAVKAIALTAIIALSAFACYVMWLFIK